MAFIHVSTLQCAFHNNDGQPFGADLHRGTDAGGQPTTFAIVIVNARAKHSLQCLKNELNNVFAFPYICVKKMHSIGKIYAGLRNGASLAPGTKNCRREFLKQFRFRKTKCRRPSTWQAKNPEFRAELKFSTYGRTSVSLTVHAYI